MHTYSLGNELTTDNEITPTHQNITLSGMSTLNINTQQVVNTKHGLHVFPHNDNATTILNHTCP